MRTRVYLCIHVCIGGHCMCRMCTLMDRGHDTEMWYQICTGYGRGWIDLWQRLSAGDAAMLSLLLSISTASTSTRGVACSQSGLHCGMQAGFPSLA